MRIKEIMEATPGNGPASATQVKPPAPARPATPAAKPATPPAGKSVSDAELNAALGMQQLKGIADRARQAGKKAADMLDLDKNKVAPLKVDPKQINSLINKSGPAT